MRLIAILALAAAGCAADKPATPGDAEHGRLLLRQFDCGRCHHIPGVAAARGTEGPPLDGLRHRVYLGGVLPNTPENLARWIRAPREFDPTTAMPDLGVSEAHARDMAAYLMGLE